MMVVADPGSLGVRGVLGAVAAASTAVGAGALASGADAVVSAAVALFSAGGAVGADVSSVQLDNPFVAGCVGAGRPARSSGKSKKGS